MVESVYRNLAFRLRFSCCGFPIVQCKNNSASVQCCNLYSQTNDGNDFFWLKWGQCGITEEMLNHPDLNVTKFEPGFSGCKLRIKTLKDYEDSPSRVPFILLFSNLVATDGSPLAHIKSFFSYLLHMY